MAYEAVIGLEVHAQLKTESKMFCGCPTRFGEAPNSAICPVCTGQPGVLPMVNRRAIELAVKTGCALGCRIAPRSLFARKQYFYPDLPKNYQISQYEEPLCLQGHLEITRDGGRRRIGITRVHLEEDAGKLLHMVGARQIDGTLVDYNRTGIPLMEIVSEPDLRSAEESQAYLMELKRILEYLGVSECSMEEGRFRCDANISLRPAGAAVLGTKAELKNMNSFKAVRDAIAYEIMRQGRVLADGGQVVQETRLWDARAGITEPMRSKEEAHDYRYFPEPDLVPMLCDDAAVARIAASIGELPAAKRQRYAEEFGLSEYEADVLTQDRGLALYFEQTVALLGPRAGAVHDKAKTAFNYIANEIVGRLNSAGRSIGQSPIDPANTADLIGRLLDGELSGKLAKTVLDEVFASGAAVAAVVAARGFRQVSDTDQLRRLAREAIAANPRAADEFAGGKERAIGALVGFVMKKTAGQANPQVINKLLAELIRARGRE